MIEEPTAASMKALDFKALAKVERSATKVWEDGKMTKKTFDIFWKQGLEACGGHEEHLNTLAMFRPR